MLVVAHIVQVATPADGSYTVVVGGMQQKAYEAGVCLESEACSQGLESGAGVCLG